MDKELKDELIDFVLSRTTVRHLNIALKEYSVQALYCRCKRELMTKYSDLMPTDLNYSVSMSNAFEEFKVPEIRCKDMEVEMRKTRKLAVSKYLPVGKKSEYKKQYNELVKEFNSLIEPQSRLIKRFKKLQGKPCRK